MRKKHKVSISKENQSTLFIGLITFILLMVLNFWIVPLIPISGLKVFLQTLLSTIATVILAGVLWEILAKERFAKSLLNQVGIKENIAQSGIDTVYLDFQKIKWDEEFEDTKSFTAAFVYAYTWRNDNNSVIRSFATENASRMTIIVPDPKNNENVSDLARRFNYTNKKTKELIEDCIKYFFDLGASVYVFEGTLQSSYYFMDKSAIMSVFPHTIEKGLISAPAIKTNCNGKMYEFIQDDLHCLKQRSEKVTYINIDITEDKRTVTMRKESDG